MAQIQPLPGNSPHDDTSTVHDQYAQAAIIGIMASDMHNQMAPSDVVRRAREVADVAMLARIDINPEKR